MTEFLGDASIPSPDSLAQLGGSLPSIAPPGFDNRKNRAASRISGFFFPGSGKVRIHFLLAWGSLDVVRITSFPLCGEKMGSMGFSINTVSHIILLASYP